MNKVRLVLNGKIVGYQESRYCKSLHSLITYYSNNNEIWQAACILFDAFIPHDAVDRSTGEVDSKGHEIYENDKCIYGGKECRVVFEYGEFKIRRLVGVGQALRLCFVSCRLEVIGRAKVK